MKTVRVADGQGFVLFDLGNAPTSIGLVRCAPTVLQSSATNMARSVTYSLAAFGIEAGGASAGVNTKNTDRATALAAFLDVVGPLVESGTLRLDPGRGLTQDDLRPLRAADPRPSWLYETDDGITGTDELEAAGILAATTAIGWPGGGGRVAIEGFGGTGLALARLVSAAGGQVIAVATSAGAAFDSDGFDVAQLAEAWARDGDGFVKGLGTEPKPTRVVFGADADVLFVGSKPGALSHDGVPFVNAKVVAPLGPTPLTTKAMIELQRAGKSVVPDFLALAGPHLAAHGLAEGARADAVEAVAARIGEAVRAAAGHADGVFLGACEAAETNLRSWQGDLPFGRPLA